MSLSVASRRPAVRTSVSRQRTSVKCTAQMPAAARNLLAAGAAAVLVMGPSASPALADFASSTFDTQQTLKNSKEQTKEGVQNLGGYIVDKLNPSGAADKLKEAGDSLNLTSAGDKAKSVAQDAKSKLNPSGLGGLGDKAKSAASDAKSKLNLSSAGSIGDKAKSTAQDAAFKVKSGSNKLPFLTLPSAEGFVDKAKSAANDAASKLNPSGPGSVGDKAKSVADDAKSNLNLSSARGGVENLGDSIKNLGKDIQKEAQQRLNPAGLRVPNPGSQDPYDNKFGDAKKNTFGTSGAGKP